jgi:hypothetical protein
MLVAIREVLCRFLKNFSSRFIPNLLENSYNILGNPQNDYPKFNRFPTENHQIYPQNIHIPLNLINSKTFSHNLLSIKIHL